MYHCPARRESRSAPQPVAWEQWQHLVGVADVGLRSDGTLIAMADARLYQISPSSGAITTFALPVGSNPQGIASGPFGLLYFAEPGRNLIGSITTNISACFQIGSDDRRSVIPLLFTTESSPPQQQRAGVVKTPARNLNRM